MTVAAVVLAAGRATRFGTPKQVARYRGEPLVSQVVRSALRGGMSEVVVVVGHAADEVRAVLPGEAGVRAVANPDFARGQSTSLAAGLAALGPAVTVAVILLADEPDVQAAAVTAVAAACPVAGAARARYDDGPGHPVALARPLWDRVSAVEGDRGARDVLAELDVVAVPVRGRRPRDIDRPEDIVGA